MANDNVTVSGSFPEREIAEQVKRELMDAGFGAERLSVDSTHLGRAGMAMQTIRVQAGSQRQQAEDVLRRSGASDLQVTVRMAAPDPTPDRVPEADRLEQQLPAMGHAGSPELGQSIDVPEADVQEQNQPAERGPIGESIVPIFNPEHGSEADQLEQLTPPDGLTDEDEERLRERR